MTIFMNRVIQTNDKVSFDSLIHVVSVLFVLKR